jgi:hypothetical protein
LLTEERPEAAVDRRCVAGDRVETVQAGAGLPAVDELRDHRTEGCGVDAHVGGVAGDAEADDRPLDGRPGRASDVEDRVPGDVAPGRVALDREVEVEGAAHAG